VLCVINCRPYWLPDGTASSNQIPDSVLQVAPSKIDFLPSRLRNSPPFMGDKDSWPLWRRHCTNSYSVLLETQPLSIKPKPHAIRNALSVPWSSQVVFCYSYPCQNFVFLRNLGVPPTFQTYIVESQRLIWICACGGTLADTLGFGDEWKKYTRQLWLGRGGGQKENCYKIWRKLFHVVSLKLIYKRCLVNL
jgi:hypothetical protein